MEFIENYFVFFVIGIVLLGFIIVGFFSNADRNLHKRKKISYDNYQKYKKYFSFKENKVLIYLGVSFLILNVAMCLMVLENDVLRIYLIVFALSFCLVLFSTVSYLSIKKYNKDITSFDSIYESINNSYVNRQKVITNINVLKGKLVDLKQEIKNIESNCKSVVLNFEGIVGLNETCKPLIDIISAQESLANGFDNTMAANFTSSIQNFIKNGSIGSNNYKLFTSISIVEIDKIYNEIQDNSKSIFINYMVDVFEKLRFIDNSSIIKISDLLINNDLFKVDEYPKTIINYIANNSSDREDVVSYLYRKKLINSDILFWVVENNYDFMLDRSISYLLKENELVDLISLMIKEDKYNVSNRFLVFCEKSDNEYIKKALAEVKINNKTFELFNGYSELLQLDSGFNDLSTRYESIALTLRYYYEANSDYESLANVNNLIAQEAYLENRDILDSIYNKTLLSIQPILNKTFKTLLNYYIYGKHVINYVVSDKVSSLYVEYKKNLDVKGLMCLSALLDGLMLINIKKKEQLKNVYDSVVEGKKLCDTFNSFPLSPNVNNDYVIYGKEIIENLYKENNICVLKNVIMHVENERLTLDKFRYI